MNLKLKIHPPLQPARDTKWLNKAKFLYENARSKKSSPKKAKDSRDENRFEDIHMFLREMESVGVFDEVETESDYYYEFYQVDSWEERTRRQHCVYSAQNSDYSFWSLDDWTPSLLSDSTSQYSDLLRFQSRNLYVQF